MSFFISEAIAAAPAATSASSSGFSMMLMPLMFIVIFYFLLWRPQNQRAKEQKALVEGVKKGDEVITNGGILGKVAEVYDKFLSISISDGIEVKIQRAAISTILPKGTIKSI